MRDVPFHPWTKVVAFIGPVAALARCEYLGPIIAEVAEGADNIEPSTVVAIIDEPDRVVVGFPAGTPYKRGARC